MTRPSDLVRRVLALPGVASLLSPLSRGRAVILRLHRIRDPEQGTPGRDPEGLRQVLAYLRRERFNLLPLDELVRRLDGQGPEPNRVVAVTIDDGYVDQATAAVPIFAEFDCPVTIFVTTGFLDRALWFWWDRVDYVFKRARPGELDVTVGAEQVRYSLSRDDRRQWARRDFTERCKSVSDDDKHRAIRDLANEVEVELPESAPPEYQPMSWNQLRACESRGATFAPHTITHPILARTTPERARQEIAGSWERLRAEASRPLPILAYPNGRPQDFGQREIDILKELEFLAAVTTISGYSRRAEVDAEPDALYRLKRFGSADRLSYMTQVVTGFERLKRAPAE